MHPYSSGTHDFCQLIENKRSGMYNVCEYSCDVTSGDMTGFRMRLENKETTAAICEVTLI